MLARVICANMLHMSLVNEYIKGLGSMKYVLNHPYRFTHWQIAYMCAFMQALVVITVEITCMLIVLTSYDPLDTVFNFVGLTVITEFDNYCFESIQTEPLKLLTGEELAERVLPVYHTTSIHCAEDIMSGVIGKEDKELPMRIRWQDRTIGNLIMYIFYKSMRIFFVSFYFYFMPFASIIVSVLLPNWFDKLP